MVDFAKFNKQRKIDPIPFIIEEISKLFAMIPSTILNQFKFSNERDFEFFLAGILWSKFGNEVEIRRQVQISHLQRTVDLWIDNKIFIELKLVKKLGDCDRLIGQLWDYAPKCIHLIAFLVDPKDVFKVKPVALPVNCRVFKITQNTLGSWIEAEESSDPKPKNLASMVDPKTLESMNTADMFRLRKQVFGKQRSNGELQPPKSETKPKKKYDFFEEPEEEK